MLRDPAVLSSSEVDEVSSGSSCDECPYTSEVDDNAREDDNDVIEYDPSRWEDAFHFIMESAARQQAEPTPSPAIRGRNAPVRQNLGRINAARD